MFFRRERPKITTFAEHLDLLQKAGFTTDKVPDGRYRIGKHGVSAIISDEGKDHPAIDKAGIQTGAEIAILLNNGYQMFLVTPSGKRLPAQAEQLRALHQFEDDLKESLNLVNLYNTSLGTTSRSHMYDRVTSRDSGRQPKPWEKKDNRIVPPVTKGSLPE